MHVRLDDAAEGDAAVRLLAQAFAADPAFVHAYPDSSQRARELEFVFRCILRTLRPFGHCYGEREDDGGSSSAVSLWAPPGQKPGLWAQLAAGFWRLPLRSGLGPTRRLERMFRVMVRIRKEAEAAEPRWYLDTLGVDRARAGQGIGTRHLSRILGQVVDPSGQEACLFTANPANLPFYGKLGFAIRGEEAIEDGAGLRLWYMVRPLRRS